MNLRYVRVTFELWDLGRLAMLSGDGVTCWDRILRAEGEVCEAMGGVSRRKEEQSKTVPGRCAVKGVGVLS